MIAPLSETHQGFPPIVVHCACCGTRLAEHVDFCCECETPVSLSQSVATRVGVQSFISVLGPSNAGKTVYLGLLLDILSKGPEEFRGLPTGSFTVDLQEQVIAALERRSFPEKTPSEADAWKWLHCQVSKAGRKRAEIIDLVSPDFAGEAIAMEVNQAGLYPAIGHVVRKSGGVMILCDSVRVRDEGSSEDLFAIKLATYIAQLHGLSSESALRRGPKGGPAVAIVFTKCDGCPEAVDDPSAFAASHAPRLFAYCQRTFSRHAFFAASVAGSSAVLLDSCGRQMHIPLHVQPRGIVEPLQWIIAER